MGELQKRIKKLEKHFEEVYGDLDLLLRRDPKMNLMQIVGEMRKEFPYIKDSSFEIETMRKLIAQTGDIQGVQLLKEKLAVLEWFVKWLADEE